MPLSSWAEPGFELRQGHPSPCLWQSPRQQGGGCRSSVHHSLAGHWLLLRGLGCVGLGQDQSTAGLPPQGSPQASLRAQCDCRGHQGLGLKSELQKAGAQAVVRVSRGLQGGQGRVTCRRD